MKRKSTEIGKQSSKLTKWFGKIEQEKPRGDEVTLEVDEKENVNLSYEVNNNQINDPVLLDMTVDKVNENIFVSSNDCSSKNKPFLIDNASNILNLSLTRQKSIDDFIFAGGKKKGPLFSLSAHARDSMNLNPDFRHMNHLFGSMGLGGAYKTKSSKVYDPKHASRLCVKQLVQSDVDFATPPNSHCLLTSVKIIRFDHEGVLVAVVFDFNIVQIFDFDEALGSLQIKYINITFNCIPLLYCYDCI
jgi:hypothetical protein